MNRKDKDIVIACISTLYNKCGRGEISESVRCDDMTFRVVTDWLTRRELAFKSGLTMEVAIRQGSFTIEAFRSGRWGIYHEVCFDLESRDILKEIVAWLPVINESVSCASV